MFQLAKFILMDLYHQYIHEKSARRKYAKKGDFHSLKIKRITIRHEEGKIISIYGNRGLVSSIPFPHSLSPLPFLLLLLLLGCIFLFLEQILLWRAYQPRLLMIQYQVVIDHVTLCGFKSYQSGCDKFSYIKFAKLL